MMTDGETWTMEDLPWTLRPFLLGMTQEGKVVALPEAVLEAGQDLTFTERNAMCLKVQLKLLCDLDINGALADFTAAGYVEPGWLLEALKNVCEAGVADADWIRDLIGYLREKAGLASSPPPAKAPQPPKPLPDLQDRPAEPAGDDDRPYAGLLIKEAVLASLEALGGEAALEEIAADMEAKGCRFHSDDHRASVQNALNNWASVSRNNPDQWPKVLKAATPESRSPLWRIQRREEGSRPLSPPAALSKGQGSEEQQILSTLDGGSLTGQEIVRRTGLGVASAMKALQAMVDRGDLKRVSWDDKVKYQAP